MEFGKTLREAREAKGLSITDISTKTHMMIQIVSDLENENFKKIVAPIYGRGFVKMYCEAVGIKDYKALQDKFMELYTGHIQKAANPPPAPAARPARPAPVQAISRPAATVQERPADAVPAAEPPPPPPPPPPVAPVKPVREFKPPRAMSERRAEPDEAIVPSLPELDINWRMVMLYIAAAALLALAIGGLVLLHRATTARPAAPADTTEQVAVTPAQPAEAAPSAEAETPANTPRTPKRVPALYID